MSKPPNVYDNLPLDQLLEAAAGAAAPAPHPIDMWLESAGIVPGTTRVQAAHLYQQYYNFRSQNPQMGPKVEAIRVWGKFMAGKFKAGRSKHGIFYYVSRQRDSVEHSLENEGA